LKKLQQYYIFKIPTSHLRNENYNIELAISDARRRGEIVSIGDSQMLRSLRDIKGQIIEPNQICDLLLEKRRIKKAVETEITKDTLESKLK